MEAITFCPPKAYEFSPPLIPRLLVWFRNLRCLHIRIAYKILSGAMQRDADYARSWQANIAMPIYDGTRFSCTCQQWNEGHEPDCALVRANDMRAWHPMTIEHANWIADNLMRHLFGVKK